MNSKLDQLRSMTTVVADTGDIAAVQRQKPIDCTTNPSIVLKALGTPEFADRFDEAISWGRRQAGHSESRVAAVADRLAVSVGAALADLVPGRVSTEVDADLSFDAAASITRAEKIVQDYAERQISRERILVKLAATWEGIRAAQELQRSGIDCNLTLVFHRAQAIACADAGVFLISPFVGRIHDWYVKTTGKTYAPEEDPGVLSVRGIHNYYKAHDIQTVVMGASFRSTGQIAALAGTIAPNLLQELAASDGPLERKRSPDRFEPEETVEMNEKRFRWEMNEDPMATEMLSGGIRAFAKDLAMLREIVRQRLN
ncbi:MAG: transaldolase [Mesorhizobium sp.]|uniref:transaldolase n=1 Tax=Mesorhizobium sp. TaxID=1871066 RepID=UPI0012091F1B|nr:transaldolase [Mesorhizobium sp.]TIR50655.1 MAG: transaldolase [Mesorhizobium sp.]